MLTVASSAARSSLRRITRRAIPSSVRSYASEAEYSGGPTFELTEEQAAIKELSDSFVVSFSLFTVSFSTEADQYDAHSQTKSFLSQLNTIALWSILGK